MEELGPVRGERAFLFQKRQARCIGTRSACRSFQRDETVWVSNECLVAFPMRLACAYHDPVPSPSHPNFPLSNTLSKRYTSWSHHVPYVPSSLLLHRTGDNPPPPLISQNLQRDTIMTPTTATVPLQRIPLITEGRSDINADTWYTPLPHANTKALTATLHLDSKALHFHHRTP